MDNFLIQVTGKKRVVLFSPRDAQYLYLSGTIFFLKNKFLKFFFLMSSFSKKNFVGLLPNYDSCVVFVFCIVFFIVYVYTRDDRLYEERNF